jgi:hypothetical protein
VLFAIRLWYSYSSSRATAAVTRVPLPNRSA